MLTEEVNLVRAGEKVLAMGPKFVIIKKGEHGAMFLSAEQTFVMPAYPAGRRRRPDRRRRQLRRRLHGLPRLRRPAPTRPRSRPRWRTAPSSPASTSRTSASGASSAPSGPTSTSVSKPTGHDEFLVGPLCGLRIRRPVSRTRPHSGPSKTDDQPLSMPRTTRTFIALPLPGPSGRSSKPFNAHWHPRFPAARWVGRDALHLTLAFLGDVPDTDLNAVCLAVAESVRERAPVRPRTPRPRRLPRPRQAPRPLGRGRRRPRRPRRGPEGRLRRRDRAPAIRPTDERFHPHITLAPAQGRPRAGGRPRPARRSQHRRWAAGAFAADTVVTYASTTTPDGPAYAPLGRAPLSRKRSRLTMRRAGW